MRNIILFSILTLKSINLFSQQDIKMAIVNAGTFFLGSDNTLFPDENPKHSVSLNSFYISQYEVSFDDYADFCLNSKLPVPTGTSGFPLTNVTWDNAVLFCNWLCFRDGFDKAYEISKPDAVGIVSVKCNFMSNGYRLPTEAEWEYAAKGAQRSKDYCFAGSNSPYNMAWFRENYKGIEHKSGELLPNELGIYDMCGNVAEWCWDFYSPDYYKKSETNNPKGPITGTDRVFKGGSRRDKIEAMEITRRFHKNPAEKDFYIGIRVVRTKLD